MNTWESVRKMGFLVYGVWLPHPTVCSLPSPLDSVDLPLPVGPRNLRTCHPQPELGWGFPRGRLECVAAERVPPELLRMSVVRSQAPGLFGTTQVVKVMTL